MKRYKKLKYLCSNYFHYPSHQSFCQKWQNQSSTEFDDINSRVKTNPLTPTLPNFTKFALEDTFTRSIFIIGFFKEIGRVDELGSGIRNTFKYCGIYTPGTKPEFIEEDLFRTIIPLKAEEGKEAVSASNWDEVLTKVRRKFGEKFGGSSENEKDYGRIAEEIRKTYGRNTEEIMAWMLLEPEITMEEVAQRINRSQSTVEKTIKKLREDEILERVESTKAGYWKINL